MSHFVDNIDSNNSSEVAIARVNENETNDDLLILQHHHSAAPHHLKILLIQMHNSSPQRCVEIMTKYLQSEFDKDQQQVHFILLPEGALSYIGELPDPLPNELQCLSQFAVNYQVILVCGTVTETETIDNEIKYYTTCLVIDQNGLRLLKYRKRDTMGMMNDGHEVGICDTIYGKIGILICYDAERPAFIEDTLSHSPKLVFNPAHLSSFQGIPQSLIHSSWKVALDTSSRYFEYISSSTGVTFLRCDQAGSGNTFLTTPTQTIFIPSLTEQCLSVLIPFPHSSCGIFPSLERELQLPVDFGRIRTEKFDNSGFRQTIHSIPRNRKTARRNKKSGENGHHEIFSLVKVGIILPRGRPKGRIVVVTNKSLEVWDPVDSSLFYSYDLPQTLHDDNPLEFTKCQIETNGSIQAHDNQQNSYEWTPTAQSFELIVSSCIGNVEINEINHGEKSPFHYNTIEDSQQRAWGVYIDKNTDLQCPYSRTIQSSQPMFYSSLCFTPLQKLINDEPHPIPSLRVILPVLLSDENPLQLSSHCLHYDQQVNYIPIVTPEQILLIQFSHNRVIMKIFEILSAIQF